MTPTTRSKVLDEIEALFCWSPPFLILGDIPNKNPSTTTRKPAFFDLHLSSKLVLKRVVRLPSLVQDLAKNADKALNAVSNTLPPLDGFVTAVERARDRYVIEEVVTDEQGVVNFYEKTTAKYCSPLASKLALHPSSSSSGWRSLVNWAPSVPFSADAIMDGQLCFIEGGTKEKAAQRAAILESMEEKNRFFLEEKRRTPLATWEIKSLTAGGVEVMSAILNLDKFFWTFCNDTCASIPKHQEEIEKVRRVRVGPDAQAPPWSFPDDSLNTSHVPDMQPLASHIDATSATLQQSVPGRVTRSVTRLASSRLPPSLPRASRSSEHGSPAKDKDKKRKRDDEDEAYKDRHDMTAQSQQAATSPASSMLPPPLPRPSEDYTREQNIEDEAYKDRHDISAQSIVQRAWAQAVRVDGTVIVLHSGDHELVCLRHRESQMLYVSNVIEPPTCVEPGYGKLHVGVYIAVIQDAIDRWQQQQQSSTSQPKPPGDGGDSIGGDKDQDDQDHNRGDKDQDDQDNNRGSAPGNGGKDGHGHSGGRRRGEGHTNDELIAIEVHWPELCQPFDKPDEQQETIHVASNRDVVLLYLKYDIYDSPIPASFLRSPPSIMANTRCPTPLSPRIRSYGLEDCLTIVLTSEIGRGATGVVHRGTLKPEISDGAVPLDVVVKLAFDFEQRDALKGEYGVYCDLKSKGVQGIATVLGFFDDSEDGACALVMLYAGVPLDTESQRVLSVSDCKSALSTLESIHRAGILHGDIRQENILMGDLGVTIIDFGHSKQCNDQEAKDKELALFRYFLGLACEISVT
ncbi:hypothetical protein M378DRAFT_163974 [Amanita muscaria Koide BX008]|uniref:Protein kinase domain-containing protein n=1 Tax=Amanita muscaria (strain Koide BX008) TaxID=946122 RepID=A0A0C2TAP3_AMAMK|nr:hypothetical protein M378DRAFT_163974 [Amanita muscaria Koide BX008]